MDDSGTTSHENDKREEESDDSLSSNIILSKFSFLGNRINNSATRGIASPSNDSDYSTTGLPLNPEQTLNDEEQNELLKKTIHSSNLAIVVQQQKTRRRKGSLRKAALLGREALREKKESKLTNHGAQAQPQPAPLLTSQEALLLSDPAMDTNTTTKTSTTIPRMQSAAYASTTSEEENTQSPNLLSQPSLCTFETDSEPSFPTLPPSLLRRRSSHQKRHSHHHPQLSPPLSTITAPTKSPLSLPAKHTHAHSLTPLPTITPNDDWDYSDTEWWGWIILLSTWIVFVVGIGSCTGVWSWAWDVGETAPAPPELEDDPTLPIVGYYPALMLLSCVMAWVWVVVAWVGMKYFRHAKISGD